MKYPRLAQCPGDDTHAVLNKSTHSAVRGFSCAEGPGAWPIDTCSNKDAGKGERQTPTPCEPTHKHKSLRRSRTVICYHTWLCFGAGLLLSGNMGRSRYARSLCLASCETHDCAFSFFLTPRTTRANSDQSDGFTSRQSLRAVTGPRRAAEISRAERLVTDAEADVKQHDVAAGPGYRLVFLHLLPLFFYFHHCLISAAVFSCLFWMLSLQRSCGGDECRSRG